MGTGDWLEFFDAFEFALEWPVMIEALSIHDFDGAEGPHHAARQPDFAVAATADSSDQFVIRDRWNAVLEQGSDAGSGHRGSVQGGRARLTG